MRHNSAYILTCCLVKSDWRRLAGANDMTYAAGVRTCLFDCSDILLMCRTYAVEGFGEAPRGFPASPKSLFWAASRPIPKIADRVSPIMCLCFALTEHKTHRSK